MDFRQILHQTYKLRQELLHSYKKYHGDDQLNFANNNYSPFGKLNCSGIINHKCNAVITMVSEQ